MSNEHFCCNHPVICHQNMLDVTMLQYASSLFLQHLSCTMKSVPSQSAEQNWYLTNQKNLFNNSSFWIKQESRLSNSKIFSFICQQQFELKISGSSEILILQFTNLWLLIKFLMYCTFSPKLIICIQN